MTPRLHKRGVSPLIATVLLIAFAVALGAVVMNWGRGYVETTAAQASERSDAELSCSTDVDIDVLRIDGITQICYEPLENNNVSIAFILENNQQRAIDKLQIRIIEEGSKLPFTMTLGDGSSPLLGAGQAELFNTSIVSKIAEENFLDKFAVKELKISPIIKIGSKDVICSSNAVKIERVLNCTRVFG